MKTLQAQSKKINNSGLDLARRENLKDKNLSEGRERAKAKVKVSAKANLQVYSLSTIANTFRPK